MIKKNGIVNFFSTVFLAILFIACGTPTKKAATQNQEFQYQSLGTTDVKRPAWIDHPPEKQGGFHYVVGLSDYQTTEKSAREEAMLHARKEFAAYTGVHIKDVVEVLKVLYGEAEGVLDSKMSALSASAQVTEAQVSRIQPKQWYLEKYRAMLHGMDKGVVYKYWVLVTVPEDEFDRIQAWKKTQESESKVAIKNIVQEHAKHLHEIEAVIASGELLSALSKLQSERQWLLQHYQTYTARGAPFSHYAADIDEIIKNIPVYVAKVRDSLWVDTGRWKKYAIAQDGSESSVQIWVWSGDKNAKKPVQRFPIVLKSRQGEVIARSETDMSGQARFKVRHLQPGEYLFAIDTGASSLQFLDKDTRENLQRLNATITLETYQANMDGATQAAVRELFSGPELSALPAKKVIIGAVTYKDSEQGGELARVLAQKIRHALVRVNGLTVVQPKKRSAQAYARAVKTRGLSRVVANKNTNVVNAMPKIGSGAVQALIDNAEAALEASYLFAGDQVHLDLSLNQAGTNVVLAAASTKFSTSGLPFTMTDVPVVSPVSSSPHPDRAPHSTTIDLEITSHLGDGQTYMEGDLISYFVSTNKDAYLLLIFEDAEQNLVQIIPNLHSTSGHYKAGVFFEVPDRSAAFEFKITKPFGTEHVWAFAASRAFPELQGQRLDNGLLLLSVAKNEILSSIRSHGKQSGVAYGEAKTSITTVARKVGL